MAMYCSKSDKCGLFKVPELLVSMGNISTELRLSVAIAMAYWVHTEITQETISVFTQFIVISSSSGDYTACLLGTAWGQRTRLTRLSCSLYSHKITCRWSIDGTSTVVLSVRLWMSQCNVNFPYRPPQLKAKSSAKSSNWINCDNTKVDRTLLSPNCN